MQIQGEDVLDVTVVICTRNRAVQLASVLDSACRMIVPENLRWEFIVVDNGSSDGTAAVVGSYSDRLPIKCIREDRAGLSNARNCAVDAAKGKYICWTDDDVMIDPNWLSAYVDAFKYHPEAALFGGKIIPHLVKPTPIWFVLGRYDWPLAFRDFGDTIVPLTFDGFKIPFGANYAIRVDEQKRHKYNPELGVSPMHKRVGEETDVMYRIFKDGNTGWWVPDSKVQHIIPSARQSLKFIYEYNYLVGETTGYLRENYPDDNYLLAGGRVPSGYHLSKLRLYSRIANRALRYLYATLMGKENRFFYLTDLGYLAGLVSYKESK